jgi:flagellar motor switch protein FliN/FliY
MAKKREKEPEQRKSAADSTLSREFAGVLGSILESASAASAFGEKFDIGFSVALVGETRKEELAGLVGELPVVANVILDEDIGGKAALLTDTATASALAGLVSAGEPTVKDALNEDDITVLYDAFSPIVEAFGRTCEDATGRPFGPILDIEVLVPVSQERMVEELPESLYRATVSVSIGEKTIGQLAIILPLNLAGTLVETTTVPPTAEVRTYEQVELQGEKTGSYSQLKTEREPSMENIDLILDIQLKLAARLGQVEMPIGEILKLGPGSVIDIDRLADEPIELVVNDRPIARGEIVVVQENFGIKITEIISPKELIRSLR